MPVRGPPATLPHPLYWGTNPGAAGPVLPSLVPQPSEPDTPPTQPMPLARLRRRSLSAPQCPVPPSRLAAGVSLSTPTRTLQSRFRPAAPRSRRSRRRHGTAAPSGRKLSPLGSNQPGDRRASRGVANAPAATSGEPSTHAEGGQQSSPDHHAHNEVTHNEVAGDLLPASGVLITHAEGRACWQVHAFHGAAITELKKAAEYR